MPFIIKTGRAKAIKDMNVRRGQASIAVPVAVRAKAGDILDFVGYVSDGEEVSGNSKWYKTVDGNYFWSENVEVLPDPPPPVVAVATAKKITKAKLLVIVPTLAVSKIADIVGALNDVMREFSIDTPIRQSAFIAQTAHESQGYSTFVENLNYSAKALTATWPNRFLSEIVAEYARKPEKIANRAYANRLGNGNEASGDGWRYRGRGVIQITGRANYEACGSALGIDAVTSPELLAEISVAFRSAGWFWNSRALNALADADDCIGITKKINGGTNGLDERMKYYAKAKSVLKVG